MKGHGSFIYLFVCFFLCLFPNGAGLTVDNGFIMHLSTRSAFAVVASQQIPLVLITARRRELLMPPHKRHIPGSDVGAVVFTRGERREYSGKVPTLRAVKSRPLS